MAPLVSPNLSQFVCFCIALVLHIKPHKKDKICINSMQGTVGSGAISWTNDSLIEIQSHIVDYGIAMVDLIIKKPGFGQALKSSDVEGPIYLSNC
ncbi:hypothetical protein VNO77_16190 [Canavalia gladiata]|uniref:Uncharacterized protein n=1 Tax=Canavalia gladiata TaxID=3824 RepID=A0AAN9M0Q5_CANGL